jgi:beta-lactamase class A
VSNKKDTDNSRVISILMSQPSYSPKFRKRKQMRILSLHKSFIALVFVMFTACSSSNNAQSNLITPVKNQGGQTSSFAQAELRKRLQELCDAVNGDCAVSVLHVESGKAVDFEGAKKMPLYSVYKLPVAITVISEVEAGRLQVDKKISVKPSDVAPGSQYNTDLWKRPVEKTVAELLELSIVRSDNTSTDKLLELIGGPSAVTKKMQQLGLSNLDITVTSREFAANRAKPNLGSANDITQLLSGLQQGSLLKSAGRTNLLWYMEHSRTGGERRLRAKLPAGTQVADKTGTGDRVTNDVGLITLPDDKGHLAIAVLINSPNLSSEKQEAAIADIARAAYDSFVAKN